MSKNIKSATEQRIGKRYSVRLPGMTSWADTNDKRSARRLQKEADQLFQGHEIIDNRTGEEVT